MRRKGILRNSLRRSGAGGDGGGLTSRNMRLSQYPVAVPNRPLRQRASRSAMLRLAFRASLVVVLVLVVAVVGAVVVVLVGPTEFPFVRDRIAATLQQSIG